MKDGMVLLRSGVAPEWCVKGWGGYLADIAI